MRKMTSLLLVFALALVLSCQQAPQIPQEPTEAPIDYAAISTLLEQQQQTYAQAWCNKDMDTISGMWSHDDDVTLWGPAERKRIKGWDGENGIKAWYVAGMSKMAKIDFKIHDLNIKVGRDGRCAVITYYVENDFVDNDGNKGKLTPRVTVVKEIQNGSWKCIFGDAHYSIADVKELGL